MPLSLLSNKLQCKMGVGVQKCKNDTALGRKAHKKPIPHLQYLEKYYGIVYSKMQATPFLLFANLHILKYRKRGVVEPFEIVSFSVALLGCAYINLMICLLYLMQKKGQGSRSTCNLLLSLTFVKAKRLFCTFV